MLLELILFADRTTEIWKRIEGLVQNEGLGLYDLELLSGGIKVTVCAGSQENSKKGVTSGDCSKVCKRLLVLATAEGGDLGISSQPQIEVNSPGINRPLRVLEHYTGAVGERVKLVLAGDSNFPSELIGELISFDGDLLKVVTEEGTKKSLVKREWEVPFNLVKRARVDFKF